MDRFIGGVDFHELRSKRIKNYDTITIALDVAETDKEFVYTGNYIYIAEATDIDVNIDVKFCEQSRANINLVHGRAVRTPFYRLYLSWSAQAGKSITLAVGVGEENLFEILDIGKALELSGTVEADVSTSLFVTEDEKDFSACWHTDSTATEYGIVGLWNPSGSGVNAFVYSWELYRRTGILLETVGSAFLCDALSTLSIDNSFLQTFNKKVAGNNPDCRLVIGNLTWATFSGILVKTSPMFVLSMAVAATVEAERKFHRPYMIPPGYGMLGASPSGVTNRCALNIGWHEKTIT